MSRSRGKLHLARICPWCGTPTIRRDTFANDGSSHSAAESRSVSFICDVCCTGFSIKESPRAVFVQQMYARERKQRPPNVPHGPTLTYKIGEIYPLGSLPLKSLDSD